MPLSHVTQTLEARELLSGHQPTCGDAFPSVLLHVWKFGCKIDLYLLSSVKPGLWVLSHAQFCSFVIFFRNLRLSRTGQSTFNSIPVVCEIVYQFTVHLQTRQQIYTNRTLYLILNHCSCLWTVGLLAAHDTSLMDWQKLRWAPGPGEKWMCGVQESWVKISVSTCFSVCVCMACCSSLSFMLVFIRRTKWVLCNTTGRGSAHLSFSWFVGQLVLFISSGLVFVATTMAYIYPSVPVYQSFSIYLSVYKWKLGNCTIFVLTKLYFSVLHPEPQKGDSSRTHQQTNVPRDMTRRRQFLAPEQQKF